MTEATQPEPSSKVRRGDPCTATPECQKPVVGRGWCSMHYGRWRTYGDPLHETRRYEAQGDECKHDDCRREPKRRGYCEMHAKREEQYGETTDPRERKFWAQVDKSGGPGACWPWTGYVHPKTGYAQFGCDGGTRLAHRIAYEYAVGAIEAGLVLDHLCHTASPACADTNRCPHRRCVNPDHLEPVTRRENIARGRGGDSWGYIPEAVPVKPAQLALPMCAKCGRTDKPVYKSGMCRPCYRRWLKDPNVRRPSQRTPEERFWEKVDKRGPVPVHVPELGRCWVWTASVNPKTRYGQFFPQRGHGMDAHRFSYELAHGSIPAGHDVHHKCHLRHCVRPAHLEALTRADNLRMRKNRRDTAA